jgi:hypothetical protein
VAFLVAITHAMIIGYRRLTREGPVDLVQFMGTLCLVLLLIATVGGFSHFLALGGFKLMRTWNRASLFIGWFSLLAAGVLIDRTLAWIGTRRPKARLPLAGALVIFGAFDLMGTRTPLPYEDTKQRFEADRKYFNTIEHLVPNERVFQLPFIRFPEAPRRGKLPEYGHFAAYLHTDTVQWSYGAIKGRPAGEWGGRVEALPTSDQIASLCAAGFGGIHVDRWGYDDPDHTPETGLDRIGVAPTVLSEDDRFAFYDLADACEGTGADGDAQHPGVPAKISTDFLLGFHGPEHKGDHKWRWTEAGVAAAILENSGDPVQGWIVGKVSGVDPKGHVTVASHDGSATVAATTSGTEFAVPVELSSGPNVVLVVSASRPVDAPRDPRTMVTQVHDLEFVPNDIVSCRLRARDPKATDCPG